MKFAQFPFPLRLFPFTEYPTEQTVGGDPLDEKIKGAKPFVHNE